jgi:hypothetical protein
VDDTIYAKPWTGAACPLEYLLAGCVQRRNHEVGVEVNSLIFRINRPMLRLSVGSPNPDRVM